MKSLRGFGKLAALILWVAPGTFGQAKNGWTLPDFSATEVRPDMSWKIYRSGSKLRIEPSSASAVILLPEEDRVFKLLIFPEVTNCIAMKTEQLQMRPSVLQLLSGSNTTRTEAPTKEVVDGHTCAVFEGVTTFPDGNQLRSRIWTAEDLKGVPVKIELYPGLKTITTTYRDITLGTPDPSLFKMPAKCTPLEKTYQIAPDNANPPAKKPVDQKPQ